MCFTTVKVIGAGMVHRVTTLPRKVRHEHNAVQAVANYILKPVLFRKRSMTALVRNDPAPCACSSGHDGIPDPDRKPRPGQWYEQICEYPTTNCHRQRNEQVERRLDQAALKTFSWNSSKHLGFGRIPFLCFRTEGSIIVNGCRRQGISNYKTGTRHDDLPTTKTADELSGRRLFATPSIVKE